MDTNRKTQIILFVYFIFYFIFYFRNKFSANPFSVQPPLSDLIPGLLRTLGSPEADGESPALSLTQEDKATSKNPWQLEAEPTNPRLEAEPPGCRQYDGLNSLPRINLYSARKFRNVRL